MLPWHGCPLRGDTAQRRGPTTSPLPIARQLQHAHRMTDREAWPVPTCATDRRRRRHDPLGRAPHCVPSLEHQVHRPVRPVAARARDPRPAQARWRRGPSRPPQAPSTRHFVPAAARPGVGQALLASRQRREAQGPAKVSLRRPSPRSMRIGTIGCGNTSLHLPFGGNAQCGNFK